MTEDKKSKNQETPYSGFPSNSNKSKETEEKKVPPTQEKIVKGKVVEKKATLGRRIIETFTGDDAQTVGHYILFEVVIPAAKNTITDVVSQGIERLMFGDVKGRVRLPNGSRNGNVSYNKVYSANTNRDRDFGSRDLSRQARATHDFSDITLESKSEAVDVLDRLNYLVEEYDRATVSDLYNLVGITGNFTDDYWGWTDLRNADIRQVRSGYLLVLPDTQSLR